MEQLATCCPHCQTRFRVTMAQLELRAGKVRCGACREIFNGIDTVFEYRDGDEPALPAPVREDLSDRMTLLDFGPGGGVPPTASPSTMQEELDALSRAIADLQSKPWTEPPATPQSEFGPDEDEEEGSLNGQPGPRPSPDGEPAFVQQGRQRRRHARAWKVLLWVAIPLLLLALAAQLVYYFRHDIAARSPQIAPYLRAACKQLDCRIRLPMEIDRLSLASSQLDATTAEAGRYTLVVLLRNQGDTVQTWPSIDLQLKNAEGGLLVRRAFLPNQYAKPDEILSGMPSRSEREIRLPFELSGEPPAGFEITIFHH